MTQKFCDSNTPKEVSITVGSDWETLCLGILGRKVDKVTNTGKVEENDEKAGPSDLSSSLFYTSSSSINSLDDLIVKSEWERVLACLRAAYNSKQDPHFFLRVRSVSIAATSPQDERVQQLPFVR